MSSKGVTPVVATVLLLLIAVSSVASASIFLDETLEDVKEGLENQLEQEQSERSTDINIELVYNQEGYMLAEVINTGSMSLEISEGDTKFLNLYIDNKPEKWEYVHGEEFKSSLDPHDTAILNTTAEFPEINESKEIYFNAPYDTSDSYLCLNSGEEVC